MNDHGFVVCAYNRTVAKVDSFLQNEAKGITQLFAFLMLLFVHLNTGTKVIGAKSIEEMVGKLKKPRRVMMLVKAGSAVDSFIDSLIPHLEKGDIIIDGGNSEYTDSIVCCDTT